MRKFYSLVMLVAVILLASCVKDDLDGVSSGSERNVRFTVDLPQQGAETRAAYTDPALKDMRVALMVLEDGKVLTSESKTHTFEGNDGLAFDVALVTGKTYKVAVWVDFGETYYRLTSETGSEPSVAMASTNITGSNNLYDAYFAIQEVTLTETDRNISMSLKRPFALVKINTEDYDKPTVASKYLPKYYATEIEVPVSMSLVNGAVSETGTVTIQSNNRETGNIADVKATGELSYDYFFAGENQANLKDFTVTYSNENGKIVEYTFTNIPFRRNYRTNITGNILTKTGTIDVSIDQDWDGSFPQIGSAEEFVEAIRNAQNGDIIQLASNITLTDPISLDWGDGVEVRVDLNGQQLTFAEGEPNDITVKSGVLRMTNGTIVGDKAGMMDGCIAAISTGGVELENVKYTTGGCALFAGDEGRIVVKNSTVTAGVYGITSNASNPDQNISVTLERSTFTGASPIMLNVPSTIVVEECRITGTTQGMVVRGGTATIGNSTITLEYDDDDYNEIIHYFDNQNWGSGNVLTCAALTIGNKAPGAYQYPTHVTLKNTELKLGGQYGAYFPALYAHANEGEGLGVTLNFDEQCKFDKMPEYGSTNILVNGTAPIADESGKTYASVAEAVEAVTP